MKMSEYEFVYLFFVCDLVCVQFNAMICRVVLFHRQLCYKAMSDKTVSLGVMGDVNFPKDEEGRTFHIQAKQGEVANRILTVGSHDRGEMIAKHLEDVHIVRSRRGFVVYTGLYKGVSVSVVVSCMGSANMDFVVREIRAVVSGDMIVFRVGSCGALKAHVGVNSFIFSDAAAFVETNYDAFHDFRDCSDSWYKISKYVRADESLTEHILKTVRESADIDQSRVYRGLNFSCDSYYSSQGRLDSSFDDRNLDLFKLLDKSYPDALFLEMENFQFFHLAKLSRLRIRAGAAAIPLANRESKEFANLKESSRLTDIYCRAVLDGLVSFPISADPVNEESHIYMDGNPFSFISSNK